MTYNQSLQLTLDPAAPLAVAKAPTASSASERRRYRAMLGVLASVRNPLRPFGILAVSPITGSFAHQDS